MSLMKEGVIALIVGQEFRNVRHISWLLPNIKGHMHIQSEGFPQLTWQFLFSFNRLVDVFH